jgi:hypothetical protein
LYFSCKSYQELAQARITKVAGYFTTNTTKLVLHFSDFSTIFYAIYKNQGNPLSCFSYHFAVQPSRRNTSLQCGPWARAAVRLAGIRRARRRSRPGEDGGRVYGPQGLGFGGCLALGGGRRAAHRRPVAAATAGSTVAWRALGRELSEARWVS